MKAVKKEKNLKEKAYDIIKHKIVHCELEPGSPISEQELIAEIGASRTPIREALNKLEDEHLIRIYPKRGIFVTEISLKDIVDIYTLREVVEPFAARVAASLIDVRRLEKYRQIWSDPHYDTYEPDEHITIDRQFHRLIAESTGNKYLIQLLFRLYDQVNRIRILSLRKIKERQEETRNEHLQIIHCLIEGDAEGSEQAMKAHLERAKETALKIFP
ncbi:FCD domain-containing protein [candidate division KSB3 bacterium]|uniref:FCD domain-containing protein n=1 Tax=candidate division KSB3 bacterium TaxID=2044937 RepID=A0A9D5JTY1_9BACT|nr:FCD domain-containing protein [candidate division KSB3 bacterium]MBD3324173.1 FCD domain-containing protein [candidate division KSB3 bacterium]